MITGPTHMLPSLLLPLTSFPPIVQLYSTSALHNLSALLGGSYSNMPPLYCGGPHDSSVLLLYARADPISG